jgi:hypothetical protein
MAPQSNHVSTGTVNILRTLLESAEAGDLVGIAFIGIIRGQRVIKGWSGYAGQNPRVTLGALRELDHELLIQLRREPQ